jgi:hypothetical protein
VNVGRIEQAHPDLGRDVDPRQVFETTVRCYARLWLTQVFEGASRLVPAQPRPRQLGRPVVIVVVAAAALRCRSIARGTDLNSFASRLVCRSAGESLRQVKPRIPLLTARLAFV